MRTVQALLCQNKIGWRPNARKIIILITDAEQHYAFDGLFGGITNTFDTTQCRTEATGQGDYYNDEQIFDYPSFGQVYCITKCPKQMLRRFRQNLSICKNIGKIANFCWVPLSFEGPRG